MTKRIPIMLSVNGSDHEVTVTPRRLLSDVLRDDLGLTGTHVGCEHGICGACTIVMDGKAARSCLTFAVQASGREIRTIESLADPDGTLHPLQQAFQDCHGLQCGYCTPGMIMNILSHLESDTEIDLSDAGVREILAGNLCRCTGYQNIIAAVRRAADHMASRAGQE